MQQKRTYWTQLPHRRGDRGGGIVLGDGGPPVFGDLVWRAQRIIVETDGHKFHGTRQAFARDRRNSRRLLVASWKPIRTTWRQLEREPQEVVSAVAPLMGR